MMNTKTTSIIFFILLFNLLVGCSTYHTKKDDIEIKTVSSPYAHFHNAKLLYYKNGVTLFADLHKKNHLRTFIPGYVDVEINLPNGSVIYYSNIKYYRKNARSSLKFAIPEELPAGTEIILSHHWRRGHIHNSI